MADAPRVFTAYGQDEEVTRFLLWRPHETVADAESFLSIVSGAWTHAAPTERIWTIEDAADGALLGMIGGHRMTPGSHATEIGYVLARPAWGRGFMSEACTAVVDALADVGFARVWASCHVDNPASARVLENAGMTFEGVLRRFLVFPNLGDAPQDCRIYAKVR